MDTFNETDLPRLLAKDLKRYWGQFTEHYWQFVMRKAYRLTKSVEDAEDLRQMVFESVLRALERKSTEDIERMKFRGYLSKATKHCHSNMFRGKYKHWLAESLDRLGITLQEEMLVDETRERQPDAAYEDKEFHRQIRELLKDNLTAQQREAVMLRHGWGLGYPAIAQELQISEEDAKILVRDWKRKLKKVSSAYSCTDGSYFK